MQIDSSSGGMFFAIFDGRSAGLSRSMRFMSIFLTSSSSFFLSLMLVLFGDSPVSIWYSIAPNEYMSDFWSAYFEFIACSGLMYDGVPIIVPSCVRFGYVADLLMSVLLRSSSSESISSLSISFASPQSIIFMFFLSSIMLSGFMSLWIIFFLCAVLIASIASARYSIMFSSEYVLPLPTFSMYSFSSFPSTKSITK